MPRNKFPKGVNPAINAKRCQHKIPDLSSASNNITNSIDTTRAEQIDTNDHANTSDHARYKECKCVSLTNSIYCRHHIRLYPDIYEKWLADQAQRTPQRTRTSDTPQRLGKYTFADADLRERYERHLSSGGKLLDLREDIAFMIALLERVVNEGKYKTGEVLRLIDMQRKCISTMNDLRKTQASIMTQERTEQLLNRIIEVINARIDTEETKRLIAIDFISIAKEYNEQSGNGGGGV